MRELVLYIAFRAVGGKDLSPQSLPKYTGATKVIGMNMGMHMVQILCLLFKNINITKFRDEYFLLLFFCVAGLIGILSHFLFPEKLLKQAIDKFEYTMVNKWSRWIAVIYSILNLLLMIIAIGIARK